MKKRVQSLYCLSVLVVFLTVGLSLNAQQTTPPTSTQDPQAQQPTSDQPAPPATAGQSQTPAQAAPQQTPDQAQHPAAPAADPTAQASGAQSFSGTIIKSGDKYMLQDEAGKTYDVDHQDEVQKYEGKRVKVHGTLDPSGKTIHLQ